MKKCYFGVVVSLLIVLLIVTYGGIKTPVSEYNVLNSFTVNKTNHLISTSSAEPPAIYKPENDTKILSSHTIISCLFSHRNLSDEDEKIMKTWDHLELLIDNTQVLPNAVEAIKEAGYVWNNLMETLANGNDGAHRRGKEKQCPHYLSNMNVTELDNGGFKLKVPCGLTQGSSVTIIGIPNGNFRIDLTGELLHGEAKPPIILHYNVRLYGDKKTENSVIVQNSWTAAHDWGVEERCPGHDSEKNKTVDDLDVCNKIVGQEGTRLSNSSTKFSAKRKYFPFKQGYLSVVTLRVGAEGIQMTVDGKHITSFAFRDSLEPWLVNEVRVLGEIKLVSAMASGLPTSEDLELVDDLESLISPSIMSQTPLDLFIGVFSTANNFKRRMAVRRTWMQYPQVRSGAVVVRFFVGLHKNQMVNEELWNEALAYRDVQLMPFVDYYSLITWKTLAICIFGSDVVSAKFIMKTDDDAFVRVDEVITSLNRINASSGLLYGLINSDSRPHRNLDSKWFISVEEWPDEKYPPWAHGPGYVVSLDIAKAVYERHKEGKLKMFKLEDVAMGIWIAKMKEKGLEVRYEKEERIFIEGCKSDYVIAHYQSPRELLCLWQKLLETKRAICCAE